MSDTMRLVSVVVPCRNEAAAVDGFVDAVLAQTLPEGWALELLIADGRSDDGTRDRLQQRAAAEPRLRWLDNPGRIVSTGLNVALAASRGEVIARMDVHTRYAPDYLAACLQALDETRADNVGGPWCAAAADDAGPMARAIVAAFQSPWLAGGARSRRLDWSGWVDTVYLGCWPRAVFERHGGFDETLVRNQDDEHNLRLTLAGARVWQDARIRSSYRPRTRLSALGRQQLQYGYWKPYVIRKHGRPAALRQLAPSLFVLAVLVAGMAALAGGPAWPLAAVAGLYVIALLVASTAIAARAGWRLWPCLPWVIGAYQLGYGLGGLLGWLDVLSGAGLGRRRFSTLTR